MSLSHSLTHSHFLFYIIIIIIVKCDKNNEKKCRLFRRLISELSLSSSSLRTSGKFPLKAETVTTYSRSTSARCTLYIYIYLFFFLFYLFFVVGRVFSSNKLNLYKIREKFFFSYPFLLASGENFSNFSRHFFLFFLLSPVVSCCILTIYINFPVFSTVFFIVIHHLHFVFI